MSGTCGSMGGSRRKNRKLRGGMGYGFGGTIGTAGPVWDSSWGGEVTKAGAPVYDTAQRGSSRRRKMRGGDRVEVLVLPKEDVTNPEKDVPKYRAAGAVDIMERADAVAKGYYIIGPAPTGAGRRRKSKKGKKSSRRRTMRGGGPWQSVGAVGAAFTGTGARGIANYEPYAAKVGGPPQDAAGVHRV
jgi:hypothetical protein